MHQEVLERHDDSGYYHGEWKRREDQGTGQVDLWSILRLAHGQENHVGSHKLLRAGDLPLLFHDIALPRNNGKRSINSANQETAARGVNFEALVLPFGPVRSALARNQTSPHDNQGVLYNTTA